ncbi:Phytanoyl-CoA dioxygenase (PhyH) [Legionella spiritensis]|uniref:Phytanoyl-CoA dioxygenase (PhyH) n=2 Tax=Legionella spiritensis TaxID=452 RepID=A0A0W0YVS8_LEGSP|nr:Phytanoyl-CoA dioxygenase (PhyH) [Legionella spiritensis]SNV32193.1 ectoine hydroxylase [Legionella spiritensis]
MTKMDIYPTRNDSKEHIIPRREPVVYGEGKRHNLLSSAELDFFAHHGYLIKPGLLADKVDEVLAEIPRMQVELAGKQELILEPDSNMVRSVFSPEKYSDICKSLACDRNLLHAAEQILDSEVYIHHSRINVKAGLSGKSFSWHSDFETWHSEDGIPGMRILTGWVFLTENNEFNGSLFVIPQSHKYFISCVGETPQDNFKTSLRNQTYGVPGKELLAQMVNQFGMKGIYGPPGTVVFHEGNLLHGSPDNMAPMPRSNIFFVYNSVENTPVEPFNGLSPRPEFLARPFTGAVTAKE